MKQQEFPPGDDTTKLTLVRRISESIPETVGRCLPWIPFSCRLGPQYGRSKAEIRKYDSMSVD